MTGNPESQTKPTKPTMLAYFDILGYSDYLKGGYDESALYESVMRATEFAKQVERQPEGYVTKTFSDNVLIVPSEANEESDEMRAAHLATFMAFAHVLMLVDEDLLIRGSLVYDDLLVADDVVFGRGIVSAHEAERAARYPRTVIDKSVFEKAGDTLKGIRLVTQDDDGMWYVDYFSSMDVMPIREDAPLPHGESPKTVLLAAAKQNLEARVKKHCRYPANATRPETISARESVISKHLWALEKFNDYCEQSGCPEYKIPYEITLNRRLMKTELGLRRLTMPIAE